MDKNNNNNQRKSSCLDQFPDPDNHYGLKLFKRKFGNEKYLEMLNQQKVLTIHPLQRSKS
jgi:hypothetical protein